VAAVVILQTPSLWVVVVAVVVVVIALVVGAL
jgi:hypothetical protein